MRAARPRTVAAQMLVWQLVAVLVLLLLGVGLAWWDARRDGYELARVRALDIASSIADSPAVGEAMRTAYPSRTLQPLAEQVRHDTHTDFIVLMSPTGLRYSHPDTSQIGQTFRGTIAPAAQGRPMTETYTGTLGPSVRAVVPVRSGGQVVGLVSVGITITEVNRQAWQALPGVLLAAVTVGAIGALGAVLIQRRLRRQTHGLGEREITRMYEYYDAVLRAVREGLVLLDRDGRATLANDEARRLLDATDDIGGQTLAELGLPETEDDELHDVPLVVGDRVLLVSRAPARWRGRLVGSVVTLRDRTELQEVTAELDTVRGMARALRAQNHEAANRLHTMVSLVEMGETDEAVAFATEELELARHLTDTVVGAVEEPVLSALLLGKITEGHERGVRVEVADGTAVGRTSISAHELVTVLGNLLDNAIDAAQQSDQSRVRVQLREVAGPALQMTVEDNGPGIPEALQDTVFDRGWSSKPDPTGHGRGVGLALVAQVVRRRAGSLHTSASELGGASITVELPTEVVSRETAGEPV